MYVCNIMKKATFLDPRYRSGYFSRHENAQNAVVCWQWRHQLTWKRNCRMHSLVRRVLRPQHRLLYQSVVLVNPPASYIFVFGFGHPYHEGIKRIHSSDAQKEALKRARNWQDCLAALVVDEVDTIGKRPLHFYHIAVDEQEQLTAGDDSYVFTLKKTKQRYCVRQFVMSASNALRF